MMLMLIVAFSACLNSCGTDKEDDPKAPDTDEEVEDTLVGKWTIEDYRTGEYSTFDFKTNGEYSLLQPFYDDMSVAVGRYKYDPRTQVLSLEHYCQEYDFGNPDLASNLKVRYIIDDNTLTLIGDDCEELGLPNPVELNRGAYSGLCPNFKNLLCKLGTYIQKKDYGYGISNEIQFEFYDSGRVDFRYSFISGNSADSQGYGEIIASGTFSVENYFLNCRFTTVSKEEYNLGYASTSLWEKFTDHQSTAISFYLALDDDDQVIISDYPLYK